MSGWNTALQDVVKNGSVESVMDVIDTMLTNGTTTYSIIGDIVDYMKFSDGNVALYETAYSVQDVMQAVVELEEEEAAQKKVKLSYKVEDNVPAMLLGDGGRIGQIIAKLISNALAIKYDGKKETEIEILVSAKKDSYAHMLNIKLQDKGLVLSEETLICVKEYFSRGILHLQEREESGEFSLSLVDLFVRQMQGKITVDSNKEKGTTFVIELPQLEVAEK
jgi:K+-sensing histidine kinase KdpD